MSKSPPKSPPYPPLPPFPSRLPRPPPGLPLPPGLLPPFALPPSAIPPSGPAQSAGSIKRKLSTHTRHTILLKRTCRGPGDSTEQPDKAAEGTKSYAEMATKAIKPVTQVAVEDNGGFPGSAHYDQSFPTLGSEAVAAAPPPSSTEAGSTKPPMSTPTAKRPKETKTPVAPDNLNKAELPKAPKTLVSRRHSSSYGSPKESRNQHIPHHQISRRGSFSGRDQAGFSFTQASVRHVPSYSSSSAPGPLRRPRSGYQNPTRMHLEGYGAKADENKEGHPFHNSGADQTRLTGHRGNIRRKNSWANRSRPRSPTSPGGTLLSEISWRNKSKETPDHDGEHVGEPGPQVVRSGVTAGPSDITRQVPENWTDEMTPGGSKQDHEKEIAAETPTPSPKGKTNPRLEQGHQEKSESIPTPKTVSVETDRVLPVSSGFSPAGSQADDTSASQPYATRDNAQRLSFQSSTPPAVVTQAFPSWPCRLNPRSYPPPKFVLSPIPSYFDQPVGTRALEEILLPMSNQPEQTPQPRVSLDEYLGLPAEPTGPQQTPQLLSPTSTRMEGNTVLGNKIPVSDTEKITNINDVDKMATNADEGYEAIGPAKVVQYAPMVQDKASKALAGHEKVNFGDIDSKKAAPAPDQAVHRNSASNSPTGFGDLRISLNSFASQPAEVRLLPRTAQSPPGLLLPGISLPPGLPIPARYYQKQGINPPTGSANISFCQPGERSTPFTQAIDHPQAGPDYYRQLCPDIGSFTVGQRSDANNSYLGLDVTDAEIKAINDAFSKYGQINKREALSLTDRYGRRGAVSEQGSTSRAKDDKPAINLGNPETVEKDNFKERFAEVFGTKGKVSIEMLQEHQKKRLVAERVRNDKLAKEAQKDPEPVPGNTGLFPYPAHGRSDDEVAQELLLMAFEQLSSYVGDGTISGEKDRPTLDRPGPWKASVEKFAEWITKDNSSFFDQYFGKDYIPKGEETASESSSKQLVVDAGRIKQTTANHGASNTGDSENEPAGEDLATKDEKSIDQGQASSISDPVIFGPPKPQGYPNHPPREHPRALKAFAPFENDYPTVRYGLLPANPRSVNTVEKSYINYRGGAVGPVADSAPRYVIGPKGYLELATDIPPPAPVDLFPFRQHKANPSPFAALEEALGTTRFTQSVPQPSHQASPKPPPGAKPTGGIISDAINGFSRVNYGGRQTQLNPDGSGLPRSEISKRKQCPGARLGINFDGSNGMEFDIDDTAFKPADHNVLGGKFKIKSQLRKEQEALRAQLPQQPQQPQVGTSHPTTPAKGISVQGKGSVTGSGTRSVFDKPPGGNLRQGFGAPGNWAVQGNPEPKRGAKGWNSGVGGRQ